MGKLRKMVIEVALTTDEMHALEAELALLIRDRTRVFPRWGETHHGREVTSALATVRACRILAEHKGA